MLKYNQNITRYAFKNRLCAIKSRKIQKYTVHDKKRQRMKNSRNKNLCFGSIDYDLNL